MSVVDNYFGSKHPNLAGERANADTAVLVQLLLTVPRLRRPTRCSPKQKGSICLIALSAAINALMTPGLVIMHFQIHPRKHLIENCLPN
jgi:hypothetical protein